MTPIMYIKKNRGKIVKNIFLVILLISLIPFVSAAVSPNPTSISVDYTLGGSQPNNQIIQFTNNDNSTAGILFTLAGNGANFVSVSPSSMQFSGQQTQTLTILFNIPTSTSPGLYTAYVDYLNNSVPIYMNVKQVSNTCGISVPGGAYEYTIQMNAQPYTQDYTFSISSQCTNGLDLTDIQDSGTILMPGGKEPLRFSGLIPKKFYNAGDKFTLTLQYDVTGLTTGTYNAYVIMSGTANGQPITSTVNYKINVVGTGSPVSNFSSFSLPQCSVNSPNLVMNTSYKFTCNTISDPNLKVNIMPNDNLHGINTDPSGNQFTWTFSPTKLGTTDLKYYFSYLGGIVGDIGDIPLTISYAPNGYSGTNLKFDFYPTIDQLRYGQNVTILVRENGSNNIVPNANILLNGVLLNTPSFLIEKGQNYHLSATAPGMNTLDYNFTLLIRDMNVIITPPSPRPSDSILVTAISGNESLTNLILLLDGVSISNPFSAIPGVHNLIINKDGYDSQNISFTITSFVTILQSPPKLDMGNINCFTLSDNSSWYVLFNDTAINQQRIAEGVNSTACFVPSVVGTYNIFANGNLIKSYTSDGFNWAWIWIPLIIILIIIIIISIVNFSKRRGNGFGFPSTMHTGSDISPEVVGSLNGEE